MKISEGSRSSCSRCIAHIRESIPTIRSLFEADLLRSKKKHVSILILSFYFIAESTCFFDLQFQMETTSAWLSVIGCIYRKAFWFDLFVVSVPKCLVRHEPIPIWLELRDFARWCWPSTDGYRRATTIEETAGYPHPDQNPFSWNSIRI